MFWLTPECLGNNDSTLDSAQILGPIFWSNLSRGRCPALEVAQGCKDAVVLAPCLGELVDAEVSTFFLMVFPWGNE